MIFPKKVIFKILITRNFTCACNKESQFPGEKKKKFTTSEVVFIAASVILTFHGSSMFSGIGVKI